jgi:hypothetical protein
MKLIDDIRRENLAHLREELGGLRPLAQKTERNDSQVSQWIQGSKNSGTGKPRGMRSDTARFIESKCGKPSGWLDADHTNFSATGSTTQSTNGTFTLTPATTLLQTLERLGLFLSSIADGQRDLVSRKLAAFAMAPDSVQLMHSLYQTMNVGSDDFPVPQLTPEELNRGQRLTDAAHAAAAVNLAATKHGKQNTA